MILKMKTLPLGSQTQIVVKQLQGVRVQGNFGDQDKWWVEVDGESYTLFTDYFEKSNTPNTLGMALRHAGEGGVVLLEKTFNEAKQKVQYDVFVPTADGSDWEIFDHKKHPSTIDIPNTSAPDHGDGRGYTPAGARPSPGGRPSTNRPTPVHSRPALNTTPPRRSPQTSAAKPAAGAARVGKAKEDSIVLQKCIHAASTCTPGGLASEVFDNAVALFQMHNEFIDNGSCLSGGMGTAEFADTIRDEFPQNNDTGFVDEECPF